MLWADENKLDYVHISFSYFEIFIFLVLKLVSINCALCSYCFILLTVSVRPTTLHEPSPLCTTGLLVGMQTLSRMAAD